MEGLFATNRCFFRLPKPLANALFYVFLKVSICYSAHADPKLFTSLEYLNVEIVPVFEFTENYDLSFFK